MKKFSMSFLMILIAFLSFSFKNMSMADMVHLSVANPGSGCTSVKYPHTNLAIKTGDMLVTNSTSGSSGRGYTGHDGIVVDCEGYVASIAGYGKPLKLMSIKEWFSTYHGERVVRYSYSLTKDSPTTIASKAAKWALNYVNHYHPTYGLSKTLGDYKTKTYCSKVVWDSYFYGARVMLNDMWPTAHGLFAPYSIPHLSLTKVMWKNW